MRPSMLESERRIGTHLATTVRCPTLAASFCSTPSARSGHRSAGNLPRWGWEGEGGDRSATTSKTYRVLSPLHLRPGMPERKSTKPPTRKPHRDRALCPGRAGRLGTVLCARDVAGKGDGGREGDWPDLTNASKGWRPVALVLSHESAARMRGVPRRIREVPKRSNIARCGERRIKKPDDIRNTLTKEISRCYELPASSRPCFSHRLL